MPFIHHVEIIQFPLAFFGMLFTALSFITGIVGTIVFIRKGVQKRFTTSIITLIAINLSTILLQLSEVAYVYLPYTSAALISRNFIYQICVLLLNLIQLEIFRVFNEGLINIKAFRSENMKWIRLAAILVHLICSLPTYLQEWVFPYNLETTATKWANNGSAIYTILVGIWGVLQNLYILKRTRTHFDRLRAARSENPANFNSHKLQRQNSSVIALVAVPPVPIDSDESGMYSNYVANRDGLTVPGTATMDDQTSTTTVALNPSSVARLTKKIDRGFLMIRILIIILFALDLLSISTFISSSMILEDMDRLAHYALMQISFGVIGIHLFIETFLFVQIVLQFKRQISMSGSSRPSVYTDGLEPNKQEGDTTVGGSQSPSSLELCSTP
ncbi:hypothetical protein BATDEDRAFT_23234 [Batrachochytrium dendrobatidis JAM81]|uniref:G-protein coupled receptors family 1 profile domain-containing protein n=2 Tax=Batrachochytrium dendrobatidis TaxID=109871 RepID=F4NYE0_BATDJ|nr:uncharacterized protein BATDEDRAFT_23234 [Batrachochytrium dendrobatidis JAM81]EGF81698.1 hypothetical protein BATDEDRAFT_23234 [Batrachochytrium dendrobatidis JAM81]OAJ40106.1 hypothetical protein BDEG_23879 [Batrachochytrium dendrobatidis JEL423]|eukprot:XP_006677229.1 hypothetical protein BATDEDRAFT_23234 [Batrachochytrium dendrobatidis JAM81]